MKRYLMTPLVLFTWLHAYDAMHAYKMESSVEMQQDIERPVVFTVFVKGRDQNSLSSLSEEQKSQSRWQVTFGDDRFVTDDGEPYTPGSSEISDDGLHLTLNVGSNNRHKYAHVTFKLNENDYGVSKTVAVQRNIEIEDVVVGYMPNSSLCYTGENNPSFVTVEIITNVFNRLRVSEKEQIRWKIDGHYAPEYDGKEYFLYSGDERHQFDVYLEGREREE